MTNTSLISVAQAAPKAANSVNLSIPDISPVWAIVIAIIAIIGFALTILRLRKWVDDHIKESLTRKEFVEQVALLVKPDMIFDQHESVLANRGAMAFIREHGIHVKMGHLFGKPDTRQVPVEIRIEFSKHLAVPPLLTPLNADVVTVTTKQGKGFEWLYILDYSMGGDYDDGYAHKYRLEIFEHF